MLQISDGVSSVKTLLMTAKSVEGTMTLACMSAMSVKKAKWLNMTAVTWVTSSSVCSITPTIHPLVSYVTKEPF